jgi:ubiquinone/menaquinone biosynthesis C-methylase UbiE
LKEKAMNSRDLMLRGINLCGLVVMDASTGIADTTLWLAKELKEAGSGRIISIDKDPETFPDARRKLGELAEMVEFIEADLTCMSQIESELVDLIVCHATICAVNDRPLKAVKALSEFYRTLKKDGWLIIDDEYPLPKTSKPEEEAQVERWQTYKSIAELVEGEHYTEIYPEELEFAAKLVGFKEIELQKFQGDPLSEETMNEWKKVMLKMINEIGDQDLEMAFQKAIERIWKTYKERKGARAPHYVMRMKK